MVRDTPEIRRSHPHALPDFSAFTDEQREQLQRAFGQQGLLVAQEADMVGKNRAVLDAIYRGCVAVARAIRPDRRWDELDREPDGLGRRHTVRRE